MQIGGAVQGGMSGRYKQEGENKLESKQKRRGDTVDM